MFSGKTFTWKENIAEGLNHGHSKELPQVVGILGKWYFISKAFSSGEEADQKTGSFLEKALKETRRYNIQGRSKRRCIEEQLMKLQLLQFSQTWASPTETHLPAQQEP